MLVVATLDEMFITTFLYRQAHTIITEAYPSVFIHCLAYTPRSPVAIAMLLDLVIVVGNLCDTSTLVILVFFELLTGERLPDDTTGTVTLVGMVLYVEALLVHHMSRCI